MRRIPVSQPFARGPRRWTRAGTSLGVALAAALVVLPTTTGAPGARASTAQSPVVVSLGDSYISGEAGRWQGNSNDPGQGDYNGTDRAWQAARSGADPGRVYGDTARNGCHRSDVAEIRSAAIAGATAVNLACSGAVIGNLASGGNPLKGEKPQLDRLAHLARAHRVAMVVVSVGGNDLGFSAIMTACAQSFLTGGPKCADGAMAGVAERLSRMREGMDTTLTQVRALMRDQGRADTDYRLVVQGYANPLPRGADFRHPESPERHAMGGCPFWNSDADWLRRVNALLSDHLRSSAATHGAQYLDLQDAMRGHELCAKTTRQVTAQSRPDPTAHEWVRFVDTGLLGKPSQGKQQESLHPNAFGQRAQGRCLALLHQRPAGHYACAATPGASWNGMTLARLGAPTTTDH